MENLLPHRLDRSGNVTGAAEVQAVPATWRCGNNWLSVRPTGVGLSQVAQSCRFCLYFFLLYGIYDEFPGKSVANNFAKTGKNQQPGIDIPGNFSCTKKNNIEQGFNCIFFFLTNE